jgi:NAD(P)-dependent dehydrogenase (short-subunit alcohol dehydrogenase family)
MAEPNHKPVAVITGGSRGLGLETARQLGEQDYRVLLGATDGKRLKAEVAGLVARGIAAEGKTLDVTKDASVQRFATWAASKAPAIDVLVNAAGVLPEGNGNTTVLGADADAVRLTIEVNTFGPWRLIRALASAIVTNGRIVNVTSGMGSLTDMGSDYFGYRASKAALNVLTKLTAKELSSRGIMVNSVCPGWVRTDMGGPGATRSVEEGARGIVWAATLPPGGPSGGNFRDGKPIAW